MGPIGLPEIILIFLVLLLVFGATRLPEIGKGLGQAITNFKASLKDARKDTNQNVGRSAKEREK